MRVKDGPNVGLALVGLTRGERSSRSRPRTAASGAWKRATVTSDGEVEVDQPVPVVGGAQRSHQHHAEPIHRRLV